MPMFLLKIHASVCGVCGRHVCVLGLVLVAGLFIQWKSQLCFSKRCVTSLLSYCSMAKTGSYSAAACAHVDLELLFNGQLICHA